ncbi:GntP family permease [Pseudothauera nasutitermitis]|uniref:GntP family permease n=1 Tax=Pseudothauera nasutitermitis TaxID=2565930 RepID=A0A4S4AZZ2_9RHOO|nr:GntP family permease [Pseudothauera nasutitermitis]THF65788.1 GntP family permease [Pseudothauera nasutitermitis]
MNSIALSSIFVVLSIVAIIYLTARLKFSVFGSLFAVSLGLALVTNIPFEKIVDLMKSSFGSTLGNISFIIIFGAAIAVCMEKSGGALSIATHILAKSGKNNAKPAMAATGFIPGLTIFCDTGYIILSGVARSISAQSRTPMPLMAAILGTSLYSVHCLVPTHPGALAAASALDANLGYFILAGVVFAVPGLVAAYLWAGWMSKGQDYAPAVEEEAFASDKALPRFSHALLPVVLPLILISISTLATTMGYKEGFAKALHFFGNPVIALLMGMLAGIWLLKNNGGRKGDFNNVLEEAIMKAGPILIITGAGGMFGAIIRETGVGSALGDALGGASVGLFIPFIIAALLKTAQGSSTVAALTTAAIISPSLATFGLDSDLGRLFAVLAIGAGSIVASHANDSYFWVVTKFSNIEMQESLRVFTSSTVVMGLVSFACIWAASLVML